MDISSTPGKGTLFKIALPLTLAIIDGLVVGVGDERYIIPTLSVRESFRPAAGHDFAAFKTAPKWSTCAGRLIPLLRLNEIFGIAAQATDPTQGIVVVVQSGANVRCLLVDALLHKQEVVIKNLNEMMVHKNPAFAGRGDSGRRPRWPHPRRECAGASGQGAAFQGGVGQASPSALFHQERLMAEYSNGDWRPSFSGTHDQGAGLR